MLTGGGGELPVLGGQEAGEGSPGGVARAVLAAMGEGRVADVLALMDPQVVCRPTVRPGLSVYEGHAGMAELVGDLHAVYGRFRVAVEDAGAGAGAEDDGSGAEWVTVRLWVVEAERGEVPGRPVLAEFTVRGGLVTLIDSNFAE